MLATLAVPEEKYVHPTEWGSSRPAWRSESSKTYVWGGAFYFVIEDPTRPNPGHLDAGDRFHREKFLFTWAIKFLCVTGLYAAVLYLVRLARWVRVKLALAASNAS